VITRRHSTMLLLIISLGILLPSNLDGAATDRQERLGLLSIVKFANDPCGASSGQNGTCLSSAECSAVSGTASGSCADSFGVCCVLSVGCGASTSTNNTYLTQTETTTAAYCSYTVCPASTDICQIRIDFDTFKMVGASTTTGKKGQCADDSLTVSNPSGPNPPMVCGTLTGQHMYVDASTSCHTIMAMIGSTDTTTSREWSIRVSQIECSSATLPPGGCLQYHTGTTGYINNFGSSSSDLTTSTTAHQNNQAYSICFRQEEGYCSMEYFAEVAGFSISPTAIAAESLYGDSCSADFLTIPGLQVSPGTATTAFVTAIGDRVCGLGWKYPAGPTGATQTLVTFTKPFSVGVNFDSEDETATDSQVGFSILYTQTKCA